MSIDPGISVAVCTVPSREGYLRRCLSALATADRIRSQEVLVLLGPGDGEPECVARRDDELPVRAVRAEGPGAAVKKNAAIRAARGRAIGFVDDDARVAPDWFVEAEGALSEGLPGFYGLIEPDFEAPVPPELRGHEFRIGGFNRLGDQIRPDRRASANCAFRLDAIADLPPFDPDIGPGGRYLPWGEDELFFRRFEARHGFPFRDRVRVAHSIQRERLTVEYVLRRAWLTGRTGCYVDRAVRPAFWRGAPSVVATLGVRLVRRLGRPGSLEERIRVRQLGGYCHEMVRALLRPKVGGGRTA